MSSESCTTSALLPVPIFRNTGVDSQTLGKVSARVRCVKSCADVIQLPQPCSKGFQNVLGKAILSKASSSALLCGTSKRRIMFPSNWF